MTVQELLLLDSTVVVPVGANQLQKILRTLKALHELNESLNAHLDAKEKELELAKEELRVLRNIRVSMRAVDLDLSELGFS